jgi:cbb3-type cytochrome oxidase maturation protein
MPVLALVILLTLLLAAIAWAFFLWTVKSGQYDDPEGAKHRMMEDDEPAPNAKADRDPPR